MTKFIVLCFIILWIFCRRPCSGSFREKFLYGPCKADEFRCLNDACISRRLFCNGVYDCADNSDEQYCSGRNSCPTFYPFFRCPNSYRCIPEVWRCDGINDCGSYGEDENNCKVGKDDLSVKGLNLSRRKALNWIYSQARNDAATDRWGPQVQKTAVALYLADSGFDNNTKKEMAYEISIQLLSMFSLKRMSDVSTSVFAPYINALLATCIDPRKFNSLDLVKELRSRVDAQNYTNPYDLLTLCNAGEKMTRKDVDKLIQAFRKPHHQVWTETQAIAVMALVCAGQQPGSNFSYDSLKDLTFVLKQKQFRNGTVENLKTTALVVQALFASEPEEDENNFDEEKAFLQILREQREDGSFGSLVDTYYVLPILSFRSLVNVSSNHCPPQKKDEETVLKDLINQPGPKMRIRYTLWIGDAKDVERSLKLRVPQNASFYQVMDIAGDIDMKYRFQYIVKDTKPYITSISGIPDDPEIGKFWFPYFFNGTKPSLLEMSPVDLVLMDNDHVALWYHSGWWIK